MGPIHKRRSRGDAEGQHGQIIVLFALMLVLLMGLAAIVVDVGMLRSSSARLAGAVDAGALAAGGQLPATSTNATTITNSAVNYLNANYPALGATSSWISYLCLVPLASGLPDGGQIPLVCDPGSPAKTSLNCTTWRCGGGVATVACVPSGTNKCNVIVVGGAATTAYKFGPAIGVGSGSTGTVQSAACKGSCMGPPTAPVDLAMVLDRTGSMSGNYDDLALAANTVLQIYNPATQWVSLSTIGASSGTTSCSGAASPVYGKAATSDPGSAYPANVPNWMPVGLSGTGAGVPISDVYVNASGTLNPSSPIVKAIKCIGLGGSSGTGTNLSSPLRIARQYLVGSGRPSSSVTKGIIFETDGTPNKGSTGTASDYTCAAASNEAALAKAAGIVIFTVGFGGASSEKCPDASGVKDAAGKAWRNLPVYQLLSAMATGPEVAPTDCSAAENADGDHFFCKTDPATLKDVFKSAATSLAAGARLIVLP